MSDIVLLLGPIVFNDFEVPGGIVFGGAQRLAIHRLPGGARVIDALGRDDRALSFSGTFSGADATLRARALDELRSAGLPLPLTWDVFFYTVVIDSFQADYRAGNWIPYKVSCTVIRDEASAVIQAAASLATTALADVGSAVVPASAAGIDLTGAQSTLATAGATTRGSADYSAAGAAIGSAQTTIGTSLADAGAALSSAGLVGAMSADAGVTGLNAAAQAARQIGQLTQASGYIGRAAVNLANAST
jgi:hypothetical protein